MADHLVGGLHCADATDLAASFVLGALEPAEADAIRSHLAGCPEAHAEFAELGSVVPSLFETVDLLQPAPALRERILAAAAAEPQRPAPAPRAADTQRVIELPRLSEAQRSSAAGGFGRPAWMAVGIAAALALLALGAWNLALRDELNGLTAYRQGVVAVLQTAAQPGAQLAALGTPDGAPGPSGLAAVDANGTVTIVMSQLTPTTGAQVYVAWLIAGSANPVPVGGFTVGQGGSALFTAAHDALGDGVTIALTLEAGPAVTTPTLPIIALGTAG